MERHVKDLAVRSYLLGTLGREESDFPTYGDLAQFFGGANQSYGPVLERLYAQCTRRDEPDLTVLVVKKDTGFPSWFEGKRFERDPETVQRWRAAVERVQEHKWSNAGLL